MASTLALRMGALDELRSSHGLTTDLQLATHLKLSAATVSRVLRGELRPGPRFIAHAVDAFPEVAFDDLFEVVREPAAVA